MTTSLMALELGASEFTVGLLIALFAALPMLLSVSAGRLVDRAGPRRPLGAAFVALALGAALPFAVPRLETLFVSSTLVGTAFMYVHIAMNSVFGAHGSPERRAVNFAWLALGFSISNTLGPLVAGFAIDGLGHAAAMLCLAAFPAAAA
ncbi:MAG TPA: MFS transporter, partial [Burkholderiales bacterium]|nr:MFS transporter [Burkholderiales bacterium]